MKQTKESARLDGLELLRGLAALLVAAFHLEQAGSSETGYTGLFSLFSHGEAGVDLFFAISGFIILYTAAARPGQGIRAFLAARFWRIFPPYWVALMLFLALNAGAIIVFGQGELPSLRTMIVSVFLLPYPDFALNVAWTLSVEMVFYLVFAVSFLAGGWRTYFIAMTLWTMLAVLLVCQNIFDPRPLSFLLNTLVLEFLMGSIAAWLVLKKGGPFRILALVAGTLFFIAWLAEWTHHLPRALGAGIPSALVVYGITGLTRRMPSWVRLMGETSFLLYLLHIPVFLASGKALERVFGVMTYGSTFGMLLLLFVATAVSCAATRWIERPYRLWYRNFLHRPAPFLRSSKP